MGTLGLFEGYGIELEYMIVNKSDLSINPISDEIIYEAAGEYLNEFESGPISWSNEFVLHVIELKTTDPVPELSILPGHFHREVTRLNKMLHNHGCMLLPTGIHPFMDPSKETRLWPHGNKKIYDTYDRIFGCKTHGWANLQSIQINLPFSSDSEFGRLHTATRLILPLIPALCASTPLIDGSLSGLADTRLEIYRTNQIKIPSISGRIIPELVLTKDEYERKILRNIYSDISPHDPQNVLRYEWLNSRGAIARFDRSAIEIRLPDMQECPVADIAVTEAISTAIKGLVDEETSSFNEQTGFTEEELAEILAGTIRSSGSARITNKKYLEVLGMPAKDALAGEVWNHILENHHKDMLFKDTADYILSNGTLSTRIVKHLDGDYSMENIRKTYYKLSECLANNCLFP